MWFGRALDARRMFSFVAFDDIASLIPRLRSSMVCFSRYQGKMYMVNAQSAGGGTPHTFWNEMNVCSGTTFQDATYAAEKEQQQLVGRPHPGSLRQWGLQFHSL